jgi:hypothetical protein
MGVISWFINRLYYYWGGSPQMPTKCLGRASWVNKPMAKFPGTWLFQLNLQGPSLQLDRLSLEPRAADPPLSTHYCSLGSIILQHMNTICYMTGGISGHHRRGSFWARRTRPEIWPCWEFLPKRVQKGLLRWHRLGAKDIASKVIQPQCPKGPVFQPWCVGHVLVRQAF